MFFCELACERGGEIADYGAAAHAAPVPGAKGAVDACAGTVTGPGTIHGADGGICAVAEPAGGAEPGFGVADIPDSGAGTAAYASNFADIACHAVNCAVSRVARRTASRVVAMRNPCLCATFAATFGCCIAAQFFRPLGAVALAAVCIRILLAGGISLRERIGAVAIGVTAFLLFSLGMGGLTRALTGYDAPHKSYGWNLFVGASEDGDWNREDGELFESVMAAAESADDVQDYFARAAIERYAQMGFYGAAAHGLRKLWYWISPLYTIGVACRQEIGRNGFGAGDGAGYAALIAIFDMLSVLGALFGMMALPLSGVRGGKPPPALLLFVAGSIALLMIVEISERYTVSYRLAYTILSAEAAHWAYSSFGRPPAKPGA
jgi:hypothetical protein